MNEVFVLIDGNSLINRAFYALPPMLSNDGRPTQAVYGFVGMLLKAIADYKPTQIAVAFDMRAPTFRHKAYKDYKATRKGMPDELAVQLPMLKQLLKDMGITCIEKEGYEADDIIGTLSRCNEKTIIITGDRDAFQLIDASTVVAFTKKGISQIELYDVQKLKENYGLTPAQIIDYKALAGDSSDNIVGVSGIGDKGALNLIEQFGSLDGIYQNIENTKGAMKQKLVDGKESAYLSRMLATIDCNVPIEICRNDCGFNMPFPYRAKQRLIEYNIKSIAGRGGLFLSADSVDLADSVGLADSVDSADSANSDLADSVSLADSGSDSANLANSVDSDTDYANQNINAELSPKTTPKLPKIIQKTMPKLVQITTLDGIEINEDFALVVGEQTVSIATKSTQYDIKLAQTFLDWGVTKDKLASFVVPLLTNQSIAKTVFDGKNLMREFDCGISNYFDVKLALYLLAIRADNETEFCAEFDYDEKYSAFALLNEQQNLKTQLAQKNQENLYYNIELPLSKVLFDMEKRGFKLDMELNAQLNEEFLQRLDKLSQEIYTLAGDEFNINSPKQLAQILFVKLKIPYPKKSKTFSTAHEILKPLAQNHLIVEKILNYRQIAKLNGTYIEGFKRLADANGVVHTEFKQTLTTTGRLSSVEPNLQNIPIREEEGRRIRGLFVAGKGNSLICADYSQIELRLLAHFSGDSVMCKAFNEGDDIHAETGERIFGVRNPSTRAQAKAVNFGIIYGISDFGLSEQLQIPVYKAHEIIKQYFEKFPDIKEYLDGSVDKARKTGYAVTLFNRMRPMNELNSSNGLLRKFGERASMNMPLQGSAADIIKVAMIEVEKRLANTDARLILQVHDELIVECPDSQIDTVKEILVSSMENVAQLKVPLKASVAIGKRWSECK